MFASLYNKIPMALILRTKKAIKAQSLIHKKKVCPVRKCVVVSEISKYNYASISLSSFFTT